MKEMERVVFFGKGGVGKSTLASNVSAVLAVRGGKVLHIGCDPKMDSTLALAGRHIPPFNGVPGPDAEARLRGFIQPSAVNGVYCVEAGGPQAGVGCAGAGIGALLDSIKDARILEQDGYTAAVFDVLGDVVCGGFAAPLRRGFAKKVVIVTSEDPLSLYSANRLIMMVENFSRNGVYLAGLAVNCRDSEGAKLAGQFAAAVNTRVLGVIPRDPAVAAAERRRVPAVLAAPKSPFTREVARLCAAIAASGPGERRPKALSDADFAAFLSGRAASGAVPVRRPAAGTPPRGGAAEAFRKANLRPTGLEGGQIVCDWSVAGGVRKIVIAQAGADTAGRLLVSDWAVCLHPSSDKKAAGKEILAGTVSGLAGFTFAQLMEYFGGASTFYGAIGAANSPAPGGGGKAGVPGRPHLGAGQWQRFIFPDGSSDLALPPDLVVVEHGDGECRFCDSSGGVMGFFGGRGDSVPGLPKLRENVVSTDFGLREALTGDEKMIKRSLGAAAGAAGKGGLVEFYSTCGPMLLGGDTAAAAGEVEEDYGVKIQLENYNSYEEYSAAKAAARSTLIFSGISRLGKPGARPRFDLAFYGYGRLSPALSGLLARAGLTAAPAGEEFYSALVSARLQVLAAYDAALCPALDKVGIKWLAPTHPYGFAGTKKWILEIYKALGRRPSRAALPAEEQLRRQKDLAFSAGKFGAAIVASAGELDTLASGKFAGGLGLLAEAGFGLELMLYLEDKSGRAAAVKAAAKLASALKLKRFETSFFSSPAELRGFLARRRELKLVYSDIRRDPRVLAAGKNPFSFLLFEPGYDGALESSRRLLELCEWEFNRKYFSAAG